MAHTDYEIGRVIKRIKDLEQENNTMVILMIGDNGASGEGKCLVALLIAFRLHSHLYV